MAYISHEDQQPRLASVVPGSERTVFVNKELTNIDDMHCSVPHFGNEINNLLFGDAQRRVAERAKDVFEAVRERVEEFEEGKIDKKFFKRDEFLSR